MRTLAVLLFALSLGHDLVAQSAGKAAAKPTVDAIFQRFAEATGGADAYAKVKSSTMVGVMEIRGQNVKGEARMYRAEGGKYYTVVDLPGMGKQEDGSDGTTAWDKTVLGPRIKTGVEKFLATCSANSVNEYIRTAADLGACYDKAELVGEETVAGKGTWHIRLTPKQGKPEDHYYDKESGLLTMVKMTMPSPMGEVPMTVKLGGYKTYGGILSPTELVNVMGPVEAVFTFTAIEFNSKIPEAMFALPPEIKALLEAGK